MHDLACAATGASRDVEAAFGADARESRSWRARCQPIASPAWPWGITYVAAIVSPDSSTSGRTIWASPLAKSDRSSR